MTINEAVQEVIVGLLRDFEENDEKKIFLGEILSTMSEDSIKQLVKQVMVEVFSRKTRQPHF